MHSSAINISNINHGECLSYPLVMIKGQITWAQSQSKPGGSILVKVEGKSQKWPVVEGNFKILLMLDEGVNKIELEFESANHELELTFEPREGKYVVTPVYIISNDHDGSFQGPAGVDCSPEAALQKINLGVQLLRSVVAEKLWEQGLGRRTFNVDGEATVHKSDLPQAEARKMSQEQLWTHYGRELVTKWGGREAENKKFVAFLACTQYEGGEQRRGLMHDEVLNLTRGHVALGGGGLAIFGTGCLHTWPNQLEHVLSAFGDATEVDQRVLMDDSGYRGTFGGCYSTTLGAVLHELCHTFDLGHTRKGIMGRGFDRMDLIFSPDESQDVSNLAHHIVDFTVNLKVDCVAKSEPKNEQRPMLGLRKSRSSSNNLLVMDCRDQIYFTQSCAYILAYHKWLNADKVEKSGGITFDKQSWTMKSVIGLKVVEIREGEGQMVCVSWCFSQSRLLFVVPRSNIPEKSRPPLLLFAEDASGNTFKADLKY